MSADNLRAIQQQLLSSFRMAFPPRMVRGQAGFFRAWQARGAALPLGP